MAGDANGMIVSSTARAASTESLQEALILVDLLEDGGHDLPSWRDQLVAAGFRSDYAENVDDACHMLWHDARDTGRYQIAVKENHVDRFGDVITSVTATYEADRSSVWHSVLDVDASAPTIHCIGEVRYRDGLPEGVDALRAGVAAAIAIRDARRERGGRFAEPLGGKTRKR